MMVAHSYKIDIAQVQRWNKAKKSKYQSISKWSNKNCFITETIQNQVQTHKNLWIILIQVSKVYGITKTICRQLFKNQI